MCTWHSLRHLHQFAACVKATLAMIALLASDLLQSAGWPRSSHNSDSQWLRGESSMSCWFSTIFKRTSCWHPRLLLIYWEPSVHFF